MGLNKLGASQVEHLLLINSCVGGLGSSCVLGHMQYAAQ